MEFDRGKAVLVVLILMVFVVNYPFLDALLQNFFPYSDSLGANVLTTNPNVVCVKGYSSSVRDVSLQLKKQIYQNYGIPFPQPTGKYELDHIIPLELGGSNSITNLQLELNGTLGYHEKDLVENYLHDQVCSGNMKLVDAQKAIYKNWTKIYYQMINSSISEL